MNRPKSYVPAPLNLNVDVRGEVKHDLYHSRCPIRAHLPSTILSIRGLGGEWHVSYKVMQELYHAPSFWGSDYKYSRNRPVVRYVVGAV